VGSGAAAGRVRMIRRPWGWLRLAWAVPPWVAATAVTIARPGPDPGRAEGAAAR